MRKLSIFFLIAAMAFVSCVNRSNKNKIAESATAETTVQAADSSTVYIYYFHGKKRCRTCIAVGNATERFVKEMYAGNPDVKFVEVKTEEEANATLVKKYEVTWNALIIAKGDDYGEFTKQAFANAVNNPEALRELIKTEVDKRL